MITFSMFIYYIYQWYDVMAIYGFCN